MFILTRAELLYTQIPCIWLILEARAEILQNIFGSLLGNGVLRKNAFEIFRAFSGDKIIKLMCCEFTAFYKL